MAHQPLPERSVIDLNFVGAFTLAGHCLLIFQEHFFECF